MFFKKHFFIHRSFFIFLTSLFIVNLSTCDSSVSDQEILVKGKGFEIKVSDFRDFLKKEYQQYPGQTYRISKQFSEQKKRYLNQWIEHQLLLKEAEKQGISLQETDLLEKGEEEIRKIKNSYPENFFAKTLQERKIQTEEWKQTQREKWLVRTYLASKLEEIPLPDEVALKTYYQKNLKSFKEEKTVRVRHILLNKKEKADQVIRRLKRGANFAKLARDFSIAPERKKGGDLGWINQKEYPREFSVCFAMNPGEISPVIPSAYGFHIFKVIEKRSTRTLTYEEVEDRIKNLVRKEQAKELKKVIIKELYKKSEVKINQNILERIDI